MTALVLLASILATEGAPLAHAGTEDGLVGLLLTQPSREQWTASCRGRVSPDHALIVGGVSARSLRPSDARAQIEAQLAAIRSFTESEGRTLKLLERTRAVQENRNRRHVAAPDDEPPFVIVQWLEVQLDADAPIDGILDELLRLGLDRYGRADSWNPNDARPHFLVRYGFSDLEGELDRLHDSCRREAWQAWCERIGDGASCAAAYAAIAPHLETRSLSLSSRPIARATGGAAQVQLGFPWSPAQIDDLELIGLVPLELRGQIQLGLRNR